MKKIILTGGGTAGHVTPNIALIPGLKELGYEISYIGSYEGIEKRLIEDYGIPYYGISSGKLRRYLDLKNITDPFKVLKGCHEASVLLQKTEPDIVFSKGGFVAVPVVLAARHRHIPVVIHESDMSMGLANRLCVSSAVKICCNFPETTENLPPGKAVVTGTPIRQELLNGDRQRALKFTNLSGDKPVVLVIGGSLGAVRVNELIREALGELLKRFDVVHLCGKGKLDKFFVGMDGYVQYEYIKKELPDLFALSDVVVSRAGANAICEIGALHKPNLLIPLSASASRGDQILNARSFERRGFSMVLEEEKAGVKEITEAINNLYDWGDSYVQAMASSQGIDSVAKIISIIENICS